MAATPEEFDSRARLGHLRTLAETAQDGARKSAARRNELAAAVSAARRDLGAVEATAARRRGAADDLAAVRAELAVLERELADATAEAETAKARHAEAARLLAACLKFAQETGLPVPPDLTSRRSHDGAEHPANR